MNTTFLISCILCVSSFAMNAQHRSTNEISETTKTSQEPVRQIRTESSPIEMQVWNENDEYGGQKEEFAKTFISRVIPEDFPKHKIGSDITAYKEQVDAYFKSHTSSLRDKDRVKYESR